MTSIRAKDLATGRLIDGYFDMVYKDRIQGKLQLKVRKQLSFNWFLSRACARPTKGHVVGRSVFPSVGYRLAFFSCMVR